MKSFSRLFCKAFLAALAACFLFSCGIEEYIYLPSVPASSIGRQTNTLATIDLPIMAGNTYFTHFGIYYRIYISDNPQSGPIEENLLSTVNPALYSDYYAFLPYTGSDDKFSSSIGSLFYNRRYYDPSFFENNTVSSVENVLTDNNGVWRLEMDFQTSPPLMRIRNRTTNAVLNTYTLYRSTGNGAFTPRPNRLFVNHSDLYNNGNAMPTSPNINGDTQSSPNTGQYTYAAMYIVVVGIDNNFSPVYSNPTFVSIFRLP